MGMFDSYTPSPALCCPECGHPLVEWQSKEGPCMLARFAPGDPWTEGDDDWAEMFGLRDPQPRDGPRTRFEIYSYDCPNHRPVIAECTLADGRWTETRIARIGD